MVGCGYGHCLDERYPRQLYSLLKATPVLICYSNDLLLLQHYPFFPYVLLMALPLLTEKTRIMKNQLKSNNVTDVGIDGTSADIPPPTVCLIVRSGSNPYFDAMRSSAQRHATELGLNLITYVTSESGTVGGMDAAERNIALIQKCVTEDGAIALLLSIAADDPGSDT